MPASANPARTDAAASAATGPGILLTRYLICDQMNEPDERGRVASEDSSDLVDATAIRSESGDRPMPSRKMTVFRVPGWRAVGQARGAWSRAGRPTDSWFPVAPERSARAVLPHTLRREARCCIPGAAGTNSKEGSWVQWLTQIRKVKGTIACQESDGQAQMSGPRRRGTRVIRRKLDCLKPNLQTTKGSVRRQDIRCRCHALRRHPV